MSRTYTHDHDHPITHDPDPLTLLREHMEHFRRRARQLGREASAAADRARDLLEEIRRIEGCKDDERVS